MWHTRFDFDPATAFGTWIVEVGRSARIEIRPILVDFDPTALSWNDAYVTDGGLFTGNLGTAAYIDLPCEAPLVGVLGLSTCSCEPPIFHGATFDLYLQSEIDDAMGIKLDEMMASTWNAYDAIYGVEVRAVPGSASAEAEWVRWRAGTLDYDDSRCFAISKP